MFRINCLGVMVVDALSGPLPQYPSPRERPQVVTPSIGFSAGGGAANTAGALGRMGLDVGVFAKIGADANGLFLRQYLESCGVDTAGLRLSAGETTPFTFVGIHPGGDRTFIHTPGANLTFGPADVDRESCLNADYLLYQDCWVLPTFDGRPAAELLAAARRRGVVTLLDECWGLGPRLDVLELMLPHCDFFLPSHDDMAALLPGLSPEGIADRLLALGARHVMLKLGAAGCLLCYEGRKIKSPSLAGRIVDTTGAGDCWDAGFTAGLANGLSIEESAATGSAAAAFGLAQVGGCAGIPAWAEVFAKSKAQSDVGQLEGKAV